MSRVGQEIGRSLALRAMPAVLLLLFGGWCWRRLSRSAASRDAGRPTLATWGQEALSAGWLADPGRRHELRYWDGSGGPNTSLTAQLADLTPTFTMVGGRAVHDPGGLLEA